MTDGGGSPFPWTSAGFWPRYWMTLRPYLFFVSGSAGWVGLALTRGLGGGPLALGAVAFFFSYGLGQALTDVSQTDTDALSAPYRPLVRGEISRSAVAGVSLAGLAACAAAFAALNPQTLALCALAVAGLASYTSLKRRWWGGPIWNSWIVGLLPLIGWLCQGGRPLDAVGEPAVGAAMGSVFGTYAAFVLLGYLKDVEADRATGYDTLPVRFGRRAAVAVSAGFLGLGLLCSVVLALPVIGGSTVGLLLWVLGALALVGAHVRSLSVTRDEEAGPILVAVVLGFVLLHLGEAVLHRPSWAWLGVVAGLGTFAALHNRPSRSQV